MLIHRIQVHLIAVTGLCLLDRQSLEALSTGRGEELVKSAQLLGSATQH